MEKLVARVCAALHQQGWAVLKQDAVPRRLPQCVSSRYNNDDVMVHGAAFYRLEGMPFGDCLPQRAVVSPEELPARFVSMAGAAFKQLAGLK